MQARKQLRAGQPLKSADLGKPDLVQRDQSVTLIYESVGLYLTIRGKALENGTEGDVVNVMNLQSKRTVSGVVTGRGQVTISGPTPRLPRARDHFLDRDQRDRQAGFACRQHRFAGHPAIPSASRCQNRVMVMFTSGSLTASF